jgi:hypothetical protein
MATGPVPEVPSADDGAVLQLPHDGIVTEIARQLEDGGEYRITFLPSGPQRLVDVRWAALSAGRVVGRRVRVAVTRAAVDPSTPITVRVTCAPAPRSAIPRQRGQLT